MSVNRDQRFLVSPVPPIYRDDLPHIGAGLRFARAPRNVLAGLRRELGDVFLVDVFGYKLFCVFSPEGLKSLYAALEEDASFGMATFDMLGFKTPIEVFMDADIDLFYELLVPEKVRNYIPLMAAAVTAALTSWPDDGKVDLFNAIRTLEQRVGLHLWIGAEAGREGNWQAFKEHLDVLSQENAFVSPQQTLEIITSGKAAEKAAVAGITALLGNIVAERQHSRSWPEDNLTFLCQRFESGDGAVTLRKVAHNAINANQGFLSNLYAALAWCISNLLQYPGALQRLQQEVRNTEAAHGADFLASQDALDSMQFCEQMLMESVRLAQRSITLRKVMREIQFDCGDSVYTLQPGVYVTTMLSVTNTQTDELARFDPDHYQGRRLRADLAGECRESVSTFGHGRHACPAQKFSHNMCKILLTLLLREFELTALEGQAQPSTSQMGGVSRPEQAVYLQLKRRQG